MPESEEPLVPKVALARLRSNRVAFDEQLDRAERELQASRLEGAAVWLQVAAASAWHSPPGLFASPRLERNLDGIHCRQASRPRMSRHLAPGRRPRVLHVLTTAYAVGGHTRLVARWIELDSAHEPVVALTRQGFEPVPAILSVAAARAGGAMARVDRASRSLLGRANALADLVSSADLVVLHTHPYDVVPSLALRHGEFARAKPPVILLNHADHLFWVGVAAADMVANLRASGARLSSSRRRIPADHSGLLPIPLGEEGPTARPRAHRDNGPVTALSIASAYKYGPVGGSPFLAAAETALRVIPRLRFVVVGPGGQPDWEAAHRRWGSRLLAVAPTASISAYYDSADLYVDSAPFASLTSMLEAGERGLPLVSMSEVGSSTDVLAFDDPALDALPIQAGTADAFIERLATLVDDAALRSAVGQDVATRISAVHRGDAWRAQWVTLSEAAIRAQDSPWHESWLVREDDPITVTSRLDAELLDILAAQEAGVPPGLRGHLRVAPQSARVEAWAKSLRGGPRLSAWLLVPDWALVVARRTVRWASTRCPRSRRRNDRGSRIKEG